MDELQEQIETRLRELEPEVELLALERPAAETLRLFIDRPDGVDLALCERVTNHLRDLLEDWSLEVSSPGPERPLTKPEHFRRFMGRRVRVRTREAIEGQRSFNGALTARGRAPRAASTPAPARSRSRWRASAARTWCPIARPRWRRAR